MVDMTYAALKDHIRSALDISSQDLSILAASFSKLYKEFQTEAVTQVEVEPVPQTRFKWVRSKNSDLTKVLLFFHGGGYTMGNTENHLELIAQFILQTGVTVLSVEYRLAPQFLFPAPLEDVKSAYKWLLQNNYKSNKIGFSGISAGGLLVTQLIYQCQLEGLPQPKLALVMSGPRDLRFDSLSCHYNADRDWISLERLHHVQSYYLPKNYDLSSPLLSPSEQDYKSYPATLFQVGDYELLLEDSLSFYQRLRQKDLDVYLNVVPKLPHCWQLFAKAYEPGRRAIQEAAFFIQQVWK